MKKLIPLVLACLLAFLAFSGTASASTLTLAKLAKQVAALQKRVKIQATTIATQGDTISALQGKLSADEATITTQGAKVASLASELAGAQSAITALQTNLDSLSTQVSSQGSSLDSVRTIVGADASSGLRGSVVTLTSKLTADESTLAAHTTTLTNAAPVLAIAPYVSLHAETMNDVNGPNIVFQGANVHVRSATGEETDTTGTGNLIVGWDTLPDDQPIGYRSGSNNLVCGNRQTFASFGGFVAGYMNKIVNSYTSIAGGGYNTASDVFASVAGGNSNTAAGECSVVSGGYGSTAAATYASVNGGEANLANGFLACVTGGYDNTASGEDSVVSGGSHGTASGKYSVVSGGDNNAASGLASVVSAGKGVSMATDYGWGHPAIP
jgi:hypothetical protein